MSLSDLSRRDAVIVFPVNLSSGKTDAQWRKREQQNGFISEFGAVSCPSPAHWRAAMGAPSPSDSRSPAMPLAPLSSTRTCTEDRTVFLWCTKGSSAGLVCSHRGRRPQSLPLPPQPLPEVPEYQVISLGGGGLVKRKGLCDAWRAGNILETLNNLDYSNE